MPDEGRGNGDSEGAVSQGPVGQGDYLVKEGDCLESIAVEHGLFWETIWNDPQNADLKQVRKDPNTLLPGDRVHVPEKREKQETAPTEQRHRFRRKGVPSKLRVFVTQVGEPRANEPYVLTIDGKNFEGTTDEDGLVEVSIPPDAQQGKLVVGKDEFDQQVFDLDLGGLDPITETSGVQKRLNNLGFDCEVTGVMDEQTRSAITTFQQAMRLEATGELDQETRDRIQQEHQS